MSNRDPNYLNRIAVLEDRVENLIAILDSVLEDIRGLEEALSVSKTFFPALIRQRQRHKDLLEMLLSREVFASPTYKAIEELLRELEVTI